MPGDVPPNWRLAAIASEVADLLEEARQEGDKSWLRAAVRLGLDRLGGKIDTYRVAEAVVRNGLAPLDAVRAVSDLVEKYRPDLIQTCLKVRGYKKLIEFVRNAGFDTAFFACVACAERDRRPLRLFWEVYGGAVLQLDTVAGLAGNHRKEAQGSGPAAPAPGPKADGARVKALEEELSRLKERLREAERAREEAVRRAAELERELEKARRERDEARAEADLALEWASGLAEEPNWPAVRGWLREEMARIGSALAGEPDPEAARRYAALAEVLRMLEGKIQETADAAAPEPLPAPEPATAPPEGQTAETPVPTGLRVLLVGGAKEEPYRSRFEGAGFRFEWRNGDAGKDPENLQAALRRADLVVLMVSHCSHETFYAVLDGMRRLGRLRDLIVAKSPGASGILRAAGERARARAAWKQTETN